MENIKVSLELKKILVVEDDDNLRNTVQGILEKLGAKVRSAENGLVAKNILLAKDFTPDMILSDIKMPEMDGIQLLKFCKIEFPSVKFLIFTGFSEFLETHSAAELGADAFLAKPFRLAELVSTIGSVLSPNEVSVPAHEAQLADCEKKFCTVDTREFFSSTKLVSDIYIRVGQEKYIKLAREGSSIDLSRIQQFKEKKIYYFFVRTEDFHKYTGFNLKVADVALKSKKISDVQKLRLFKHTGEMLLQQMFVSGLDAGARDAALAMTENTLKAVSENDELFEVLMGLQLQSDTLYRHSLCVSVYACLIAVKMGWTSLQNQHKISLAGLFHDIGFKEMPSDLHDKPRFKMTPAEVELYESHPTRGKEILASIPGFPSDLAMIIGQHHENCRGQGFPLKLSGLKTHPIAKLIHLADELVDKMSSAKELNLEVVTMILNDFYASRCDEFDRDVLAGAFDVFSIARPKNAKIVAA